MAVFRIEKTRDYTVMSNHHLRNTDLSLKAKGLLSLMLSLPEEWDYTTKGLARICKDGVDSICAGVRELEDHGYVVRERVRNANGQLGAIEYTILEQPRPPEPKREKPERENPVQANPVLGSPVLGKPEQENPDQLNIDISSNQISKKDLSITQPSNPIQSNPPILTFVMCYELIQLVTEKNNMHDVDTWMFFKWIFKTFCAVLIVTNTWNIVMAIFDVGQSVVSSSAGVIIGDTSIDVNSVITDLEAQVEALSTGELFGLWFQSLFVGLTMNALSICIMLVIYGRMIEVYLTTSIGPIPLATMTNRDWSSTGQNYLKSLFALAFQAFLIMVCVGIYSVLVQSIATSGDISGAIWSCMGYTVLLCFALFKTGSLSKSLFGAH